ncbi:unnamed protein product, partial [Mesorhabditis belari]|uniref:Battenin n=1 Tax=Mesorhabditis belari TaxID=2138241 RepID=A0AAF3FQN1_9BILA
MSEKSEEVIFEKPPNKYYVGRSLIAFWIFGICNNFGYVVMLSAAQDILRVDESKNGNLTKKEEICMPDMSQRVCTEQSAGLVLMMNILPITRSTIVIVFQVFSLLITAFATNVPMALTGVAMASVGCGFGEIMYLALAAHYSANVLTSWSSGTGMAGILGAALYAAMTDPRMLALTPRTALLLMLVGPTVFAVTYCLLLARAPTVKKTVFHRPSTWIEWKVKIIENGQIDNAASTDSQQSNGPTSVREKLSVSMGLLKYMIPLGTVYFAQYFINQGLAELIIFDCTQGLHSSPDSQYKWYQVLYQIGVFISRSMVGLISLPFWVIVAVLPISQMSIMSSLLLESLSPYLPHILVVYGIILLEGLVGGSAYANTVRHVHKNVSTSVKEFALLIVTAADTVGILIAAILSIPTHNYICHLPYYDWF